ncbi:MAG: TPR end-of-group domain-containing protein [Planctomycetia bacterium]
MSLPMADLRRLQRAEGYLALDLPRQAIAELQAASPSSRQTYEWLMLRAECHRATADHHACLQLLRSALLKRPEEAVAVHLMMSWCFKRTNQIQKAIDGLIEAERLCRVRGEGDHRPLVAYNLSCYYALAGKRDEMLEWLAQAVDLDPSLAENVKSESDFDRFRHDANLIEIVRAAKQFKTTQISSQ